ncbi:hypothetical protein EVAR_50308_1 [Eumeta japonica]|uniref:Uncharacterized protein n=1 Tax=Eumeta variegata TaxID=151549 RepID=A0A4C1ZY76_EUMVA|nr:hypothetical protein EVAR_50308_1 [Eumeta japonica]
METLATIDAPHQKNGTTGQNSRIQTSSRPLPRSTRHLQFARPRHVPRPKPNRRNRQKSRQRCTQQKPRLHNILDLNTSLLQSTGNMITELATALTLAARRSSSAYDLPTFYGAHQEWLMFKASYVDTHVVHRTRKHVKVEKKFKRKSQRCSEESTQL